MLIKMNKPPEATKELDLIVRFWITMSKFYDQHGSFDRDEYKVAYPVESTCILAGRIRENLWLKRLLNKLSKKDRQSIIHALEHDNSYALYFNNTTYTFEVCCLESKLQKRLVKVFESIYNTAFSNRFNLRAEFIAEYKFVNGKKAQICPACLGSIELDYVDIDHYFPKTIYPTLSVNSDNLIPLCGVCNQRVKKDRKPTDPDKVLGTNFNFKGCLTEIYYPYNFNGDAIDEFNVKILNCKVVIEAADKSSAQMKKRVNNIVQLFKLSSRWTTLAFNTIEEELRIEICSRLLPLYNISEALDHNKIIICLQYLEEEYQEKCKKIRDAFVKLIYIQWSLGEGSVAFYDEISQSLREKYLYQNKKRSNVC